MPSSRSPGKSTPDEQFPTLTGVRAIAAYLVFFHHYTPSAVLTGTAVHKIVREGHVGVTVFYVLSGLLIAWNYMGKETGNAPFWGPYILKRVARIQPVYLLLLALAYITVPAASAIEVLLNVTLLKGYFPPLAFSGIPQAWSLTVEETFYLTAPFLFIGIRRYGTIWVQAALWTTGILLIAGTHVMQIPGFAGSWAFFVSYTFFGRSFEFLTGIVCAEWLRRRTAVSPVHRQWSKYTWGGISGVVGVMFWLSTLQVGAQFGVLRPEGMLLNNLLLPLFVGLTFLGLVTERTIISRILSTRVFLLLGRSSYAFYLVHFGPPAIFIAGLFPQLAGDMAIFALFAAVNSASILLYLYYEHPMNRLVRRAGADLLGIGRNISPLLPYHRNRAVAACCVLAIVFVFSALPKATQAKPVVPPTAAARPESNALLHIPGSPALEYTARSHGSVFPPTSRITDVPTLTGFVGGHDIRNRPYIFAHANSVLEYNLEPGRWSRLSFSMGLDDVGGADAGTVTYTVAGDGKVLFSSNVIRSGVAPTAASVSITGVRNLQLRISDGGDTVNFDESYWIDPRLQ